MGETDPKTICSDPNCQSVTHLHLERRTLWLSCGAQHTDLFWQGYCWVHTFQSTLGLALVSEVGKGFHLAGGPAA